MTAYFVYDSLKHVANAVIRKAADFIEQQRVSLGIHLWQVPAYTPAIVLKNKIRLDPGKHLCPARI